MQLTQDYVDACAQTLMEGAPAERVAKALDLCALAVRENAPGLMIMVGHALSYRQVYDWAEYVFSLAAQLPEARGHALFELAVVASSRGDLEGARTWLQRLEGEEPLDAYRQRTYGHILGRLGDLDGARARLDASFQLDPANLRECLAFQQFCEYFDRFPKDEALRRCEALPAFYPFRSSAEIADDVAAALRDGRPYSMVRMNDGEGSVLYLSLDDESAYPDLYRRNRGDFHQIWFGHTDNQFDPHFLRAMRTFNDSLASADAIGAFHPHSIIGEYSWGSIRNVPCIFNIVRKLEMLQATVERGRINLCHPQINQQFLFEGHLERLLSSQARIGLVSCHGALPDALKSRFGLKHVHFHQTPGEASLRKGSGAEPFQVWHGRICDELSRAEPGVMYLVAAGVQAKIYCEIVKRAGGVALDVGAVADVWMSAPTRGYHEDVSKLALTDGDRSEPTTPSEPPPEPIRPSVFTTMGSDRWWGAAEVLQDDPPVEEHAGAYYLPWVHDAQWGLFDSSDTAIEPAIDRFLPDDRLMGQVPTSYTRLADIEEALPEGDYLYGGRFNAHFGHFLVESIPRLWPLAEAHTPGQKIIMHGEMNPDWWFAHPWVSDVFGALGLTRQDFIHSDRPFRIPRITVPHTSFQQQKYAHQAYRRVCQAVGGRLLGDAPLVRNERPVWLSKSRLPQGVRRVSNEVELEIELRARGFQVVYPETLSFAEKVRLFGTRTVCGSIMSAMHVTIFSPVAGRQIWVHPYDQLNTNFVLVDMLHGNQVTYLRPEGATERPVGERWMVTAEIPDPKRVAEELAAMVEA